MDLLRRNAGTELLLRSDDTGVLVSGPAEAVHRLVERLGETCQPELAWAVARRATVTGAAATTVASATHTQELVVLSPESLRLLRENGAIPSGDGWYRMFVKDDLGRFAGNLEWQTVRLPTGRVLALQQAGIALALRAAIKEVGDAVAASPTCSTHSPRSPATRPPQTPSW